MKFRKTALFLLAVLVISGCTGGKGKQTGGPTLQSGVLSVGMEIGYPPMEYYDADGKTAIGFDVRLGTALAEKLGLKARFVDTAWDGIFAAVETGKFDCIISAVTITDARIAAHNFSKPYVANAMAMVLLKGSSVKARSPQECAGLGVSYQAETTADFYMERLAEQGLKFIPYEYDRVIGCFDELKLGRVDVVVTDVLVAYDYVSAPDSPFEIVWQGPADEKFGICMKKGNNALSAEIDRALDELFADGTMLRISQEVFGLDMVSAAR